MKWCLLLVIALYTAFPALAEEKELHAGIETRVEIQKAQDMARENNQKQISAHDFDPIDPKQLENLQLRLKQIRCLPDRQMSVFDTGNYSVGYFGEYKSLYYHADGSLYQVELRNKPVGLFSSKGVGAYPIKTRNYAYPSGELIMSRIATAYGHDFAFTPEGLLEKYCIGANCYNPLGQVIGTRNDSFPCPSTHTNSGASSIINHPR
jgi:hypothetical protein